MTCRGSVVYGRGLDVAWSCSLLVCYVSRTGPICLGHFVSGYDFFSSYISAPLHVFNIEWMWSARNIKLVPLIWTKTSLCYSIESVGLQMARRLGWGWVIPVLSRLIGHLGRLISFFFFAGNEFFVVSYVYIAVWLMCVIYVELCCPLALGCPFSRSFMRFVRFWWHPQVLLSPSYCLCRELHQQFKLRAWRDYYTPTTSGMSWEDQNPRQWGKTPPSRGYHQRLIF